MSRNPGRRPGLAVLLLAACAGCATAPEAPPPTLPQQIEALIGDAPCRSSDECRTIAYGQRACGGPQSYLAWSATHTDAAALAALVARHRQERLLEIDRSGEKSTCAVLTDPGARCLRSEGAAVGRCVLQPRGPSPLR